MRGHVRCADARNVRFFARAEPDLQRIDDFQRDFILNREYVIQETPYDKPIVPGALTFSVSEGLTILSGILHGTGIAFLGVKLTVTQPVFIDDTIHVDIEVVGRRETMKVDRGIVTFNHRVSNQAGEAVMEYTVKRMIRRRL